MKLCTTNISTIIGKRLKQTLLNKTKKTPTCQAFAETTVTATEVKVTTYKFSLVKKLM